MNERINTPDGERPVEMSVETSVEMPVETSAEMPVEMSLETLPETADSETREKTPAQAKKKSHMKLWVSLATIAVIVAAAGGAFQIWHEQPSFCSAICHSPMDPYVEDYYSDKGFLSVVAHRTSGVSCLNCHDSTLSEQITEAFAWISGDFADPLSIRRFGTIEFCNRCHNDGDPATGIDWEAIVAATANYQNSGRNPHDSHLEEINCYTCHSIHRSSKLYCTQCHDNISVPAKWK